MHVTDLTRKAIIARCVGLINTNGCRSIVTINSLMVKCLWHNYKLSEAISKASLITADSIGVSLASILLERRRVCRYPGIEMMEDLIKQGWKVYLLGGRKWVAERAAGKLKIKYPDTNICGTHHGYFGNIEEEEEILNDINKLKPDIVFIGLNMPRQEIWINRNKEKLKAGVIIGVGGSFDVVSGRLLRAPYIFKFTGNEWLWRLLIQPWRITRILGLPVFLFEVICRFIKNKTLLNPE